MRQDKIRSIAGEVVRHYGTASPFELCDFLSIPVLRLDLPRCMRGFCYQGKGKKSVIVMNQSLPPKEEGYCCAHELGHALLHPGANAQVMADLTNLCVGRYEREADYFAACLYIDPNLGEWGETYHPLTLDIIAALTGLPERIVRMRFGQ